MSYGILKFMCINFKLISTGFYSNLNNLWIFFFLHNLIKLMIFFINKKISSTFLGNTFYSASCAATCSDSNELVGSNRIVTLCCQVPNCNGNFAMSKYYKSNDFLILMFIFISALKAVFFIWKLIKLWKLDEIQFMLGLIIFFMNK
jgi:hypothetical protein